MIPVRFQYIQTQYTNVKLLLFSTSNEHSKTKFRKQLDSQNLQRS